MEEKDKQIYVKAMAVIRSCKTFEQLKVALNYADLVKDNMSTKIKGRVASAQLIELVEEKLQCLTLEEVR